MEGNKYRICQAKEHVYVHKPNETEMIPKEQESKLPELVQKIIQEGKQKKGEKTQ